MRNCLLALLCVMLAACAGPQAVVRAPASLFDDSLFSAPSERVGADDVFAMNDAMRAYLQRPEVVAKLFRRGPQQGLIDALYQDKELRLRYDTERTRNAAQAFDERAGNCLSLVIMTAAFAKQLGLPVRYQSAYLEESVSRSHDLVLRSGHVNVTLGRRLFDGRGGEQQSLTVDFLPPQDLVGLRTREISEDTVVAMYMNNRAVEALVAARLDDAYAWAREAVQRNPQFLPALNTLGVVYLRRGALSQAALVFGQVLEQDPAHRPALANLAGSYARMGRVEESRQLERRLAQLEPEPPLHHFNLGIAAMKRQDFAAAKELFSREVARSEDFHEAHYWLGLANFQLGNADLAQRHFARALKSSTSSGDRKLYSAKLDWLKTGGRGN
jgi:tetratricopeptide (TPR) repeat protein